MTSDTLESSSQTEAEIKAVLLALSSVCRKEQMYVAHRFDELAGNG